MTDHADTLVDILLCEIAGAVPPTDLADRILERAGRIRARRLSWRWGLATTAACCAALVLAMLMRTDAGARHRRRDPAPGTVVTSAGRSETLLWERAMVILSPGSVVDVLAPAASGIHLATGEALCLIEPGSGPFRVTTAIGEVQVTGTRFGVRVHDAGMAMTVSVQEGSVNVSGAWGVRTIHAGSRLTVPPGPAGPSAAVPGVVQPGRPDPPPEIHAGVGDAAPQSGAATDERGQPRANADDTSPLPDAGTGERVRAHADVPSENQTGPKDIGTKGASGTVTATAALPTGGPPVPAPQVDQTPDKLSGPAGDADQRLFEAVWAAIAAQAAVQGTTDLAACLNVVARMEGRDGPPADGILDAVLAAHARERSITTETLRAMVLVELKLWANATPDASDGRLQTPHDLHRSPAAGPSHGQPARQRHR